MRVMLAVGALASLAGAASRAVHGDWAWAAVCTILFWVCALLFVAYTSARSKLDNITGDEK